MRTLTLAALAAAAVATPAFAQDTPAGPPAEKPAFDGFRAGALLGYDALQPGSSTDSAISDRNGADGLLYGGDIGYDKTIGNAVIGAEAEIAGSTAKATNDPFNGLGFGRVKAGRDIYVGARVGTLLNPTTLLYVKGGYTNSRLDLTASDGTTETGQHFNLDGYRVGAGVEKSLTPRTYAKIEYRYSNYGSARLEYPNGANTSNFGVDTDRHQVALGFGFRF
ncbi:MAG: outer membrane beta-barrel protein [Sphingomonas sp.]|jgi:outer membrane immunogenic protein